MVLAAAPEADPTGNLPDARPRLDADPVLGRGLAADLLESITFLRVIIVVRR